MVQAGIAPDRGEAEVRRFTRRRIDKDTLVVALVGFDDEGAVPAAEDSHVAVAGVTKQFLAALVMVQRFTGQAHYFGADG